MRAARHAFPVALAGAVLVLAALPARGALPPMYGGTLRLPAPRPVTSLDPAQAADPFTASLAASVCDGLYEVDDRGRVVPLLAAGLPEVEGTVATIRLRPGVVRHAGTPLRAASVAHTLRRADEHPQAAWLLSVLARDQAENEPDIRTDGTDTVEVHLAEDGHDGAMLARVLAAAPLALATGRDPARRPLGTGPFSARFASGGEIRLHAFRHAAEGAPYLDQVRISSPRPRQEALRAFELGRIDGSWHGESLYGGAPVRPVTSTRGPAVVPVLLVPNLSSGGALAGGGSGATRSSNDLWRAVASRIDRRRLERVGIDPSPSLGAGLPPPRIGGARPPRSRVTLRMLITDDDYFEEALAEALAGILDEMNVTLRVAAVPASRYDATARSGAWDLRLAAVSPPLPGKAPLLGAAFVATGQHALARRLAPRLGDDRQADALSPRLHAIVLGQREQRLWHPAAVQRVGFDALGRLVLGEMAMQREE